jgi:hypothetical protein
LEPIVPSITGVANCASDGVKGKNRAAIITTVLSVKKRRIRHSFVEQIQYCYQAHDPQVDMLFKL